MKPPDLFCSQNYIILASRRFQPLQYDIQFRLKKASNPSISWSTADPELTATWLSTDAKTNAISVVAQITLPRYAQPIQEANQQTYAVHSCTILASTSQTQPKLPPSGDHKTIPDNKICCIFNQKGSCFEAQDAHTYMCVTSAREGTQSRPALIALNQHKICTPLRPQTFA